MDISGIQLRAVRAALFTAFVVTLSAASHVLLSQVALPSATVAVTSVAVFATAYTLAGRERGFGRIAALLIPLELAADTLFTSGQHFCYGRSGGPVTGALRSVGFDVLCGGSTNAGLPLRAVTRTGTVGTGRLPALLADAGPATAWVLLGAHVCVGLLAAAWLHRGERALVQLLRAVATSTFRPLRLAATALGARLAPVRRMPRPAARSITPRARLLVHSLGRRGPPCSPVLG